LVIATTRQITIYGFKQPISDESTLSVGIKTEYTPRVAVLLVNMCNTFGI